VAALAVTIEGARSAEPQERCAAPDVDAPARRLHRLDASSLALDVPTAWLPVGSRWLARERQQRYAGLLGCRRIDGAHRRPLALSDIWYARGAEGGWGVGEGATGSDAADDICPAASHASPTLLTFLSEALAAPPEVAEELFPADFLPRAALPIAALRLAQRLPSAIEPLVADAVALAELALAPGAGADAIGAAEEVVRAIPEARARLSLFAPRLTLAGARAALVRVADDRPAALFIW
jgi:hypothetical protein